MADWSRTVHFTVHDRVGDAHDRVAAGLSLIARIRENGEDRIVAKRGSQIVTRLLGASFTRASWLPMQATVVLERGDDSRVDVTVTVEDTFGFGTIASMRERYEHSFDEVVDAVRKALR